MCNEISYTEKHKILNLGYKYKDNVLICINSIVIIKAGKYIKKNKSVNGKYRYRKI